MGFFSRKPWDLAALINAARSIKSSEVIFQVGEPVIMDTPAGERRVAGHIWTQALYDERILSRLDALAREAVRTTGRCEWPFAKDGIGKVAAEVGPVKARLKLL
jgi:hypothetical protein